MDAIVAADVLGVAPGAGRVVVERAFRAAARRCHPDVGGDRRDYEAAVEARRALLERRGAAPPAPGRGAVVVVADAPWWRDAVTVVPPVARWLRHRGPVSAGRRPRRPA